MKKDVNKLFVFLVFAILLFNILLVSLISAQKHSINVTAEHPFLLADGTWISAKDLKVGMQLMNVNGKPAKVTSVKEAIPDKPVMVYNLEAGKYSNFILPGGVVVHNSNACGTSCDCIVSENAKIRVKIEDISGTTETTMTMEELNKFFSEKGSKIIYALDENGKWVMLDKPIIKNSYSGDIYIITTLKRVSNLEIVLSEDNIQLADGRTIKASQLQNGMIIIKNCKKLYVYNVDTSEECFVMYDLFEKSQNRLKLTPNHVIATNRGEIPISDFKLTDVSWDSEGKPIIFTNIKKCNVKEKSIYTIDEKTTYRLDYDSPPLRDSKTPKSNPPSNPSKSVSPVNPSRPNIAQEKLDSGGLIDKYQELNNIAKQMGYNLNKGEGREGMRITDPKGNIITDIPQHNPVSIGVSKKILKALSTGQYQP